MRDAMTMMFRSLSLALIAGVLLGACAPRCERVCTKLRDCDISPRLNQVECVESCERQIALYDQRDDDERKEAFAAHRRCIVQATCGEIDDGVCYDDAIYPF